MSPNTVHKPFRFPLMLAVLTVMIVACAEDSGGGGGGGPQYYNYATVSRTKGVIGGHFTSGVSIYTTEVSGNLTRIWVEGLPPGLSYSDGKITGTPTQLGHWDIDVNWSGICKDGVERSWHMTFDIGIYSDLTEDG